MNKFITFALVALCATMAHSHFIGPIHPYNSNLEMINTNNGGSSAVATTTATAASNSANTGITRFNQGVVSPLGYPYPYANNLGLNYAPLYNGLGLGGLGSFGGLGAFGGPYGSVAGPYASYPYGQVAPIGLY